MICSNLYLYNLLERKLWYFKLDSSRQKIGKGIESLIWKRKILEIHLDSKYKIFKFGHVPEARDSGTECLELSQKPRVPTAWGIISFAISETLKPGTVPESLGLWQSTRSLKKSWDFESRHHWVLFIVKLFQEKSNLKHVGLEFFWNCPNSLGSQDCPKDLEYQYQGVYFSISDT